MDKTIAFLLLIIAGLTITFALYAQNNKQSTKQSKIDSVIVKEIVHDSIYKTIVKTKQDSFIKYVTIRDSILLDTNKIDSVLATKVDTLKDLRITAIVLADSLSTCKENLENANKEIAHNDSAFKTIAVINKQPESNKIDYKSNTISFLLGLLTYGLLQLFFN